MNPNLKPLCGLVNVDLKILNMYQLYKFLRNGPKFNFKYCIVF